MPRQLLPTGEKGAHSRGPAVHLRKKGTGGRVTAVRKKKRGDAKTATKRSSKRPFDTQLRGGEKTGNTTLSAFPVDPLGTQRRFVVTNAGKVDQ